MIQSFTLYAVCICIYPHAVIQVTSSTTFIAIQQSAVVSIVSRHDLRSKVRHRNQHIIRLKILLYKPLATFTL